MRQRLAQVAQLLNDGGLARRHLHERVRRRELIDARRRERLGRQPLPVAQIELGPFGLGQRPVAGLAPLVLAHDPELHRRLAHHAGVDALEPVVVPFEDFVVERVERALEMRRTGEHELLGRDDIGEIALRTVEVGLVRVAVPAGAGIDRHLDLGEIGLAALDHLFLVVGIDQQIEIGRHVLAFLRQQIEHVRIHAVVGIGHRLAPVGLPGLGQLPGRPLVLMDGGEMADQIAEQVQHAARIFLAEAAQHAIGTARVEREDCLEMRGLLLSDVKLLGAEAGNADHADIAVAPGLGGDPFDQVVAVPFARAAAFRLADAARRADHMHVAARGQEMGVAGFLRTGP